MPLTDIPVPPTVTERPVVSDLESYWNDSTETGLQFCVFLLSLWHYHGVCGGETGCHGLLLSGLDGQAGRACRGWLWEGYFLTSGGG